MIKVTYCVECVFRLFVFQILSRVFATSFDAADIVARHFLRLQHAQADYNISPLNPPPPTGRTTAFIIDPGYDYRRDDKAVSTDLMLEIAIFVDHLLWNENKQKFGLQASDKLRQFIFSIVQNAHLLYQHRSVQPKIHFSIVHYDVLTKQSTDLRPSMNPVRYLGSFCNYQLKMRRLGYNWDIAVLFTGQNLRSEKGRYVTDYDGYARMSGVCNPRDSCLVVEAFNFYAPFILAHELGHSFNMSHDEDVGCSMDYLMTSTIGQGQVILSPCSIRALQRYVNQLDKNGKNCMRKMNSKQIVADLGSKTHQLPGHLYSANEQCRRKFGPQSHHHKEQSTSMCRSLDCKFQTSAGIIWRQSVHPALEGTTCSLNKQCSTGECVGVQELKHQPANPRLPYEWTSWTNWSHCTTQKNDGRCMKTRSRTCLSTKSPRIRLYGCYGHDAEKRACPNSGCSSSRVVGSFPRRV